MGLRPVQVTPDSHCYLPVTSSRRKRRVSRGAREGPLTCGNQPRYNALSMILVLSLLLLVQSDEISNLRDVNPVIRRNAISTLAEKGNQAAVRPLIDLLVRETDDSVRNAAVDALERLTSVKGNGPDFTKWQRWWEEIGQRTFRTSNVTAEAIQQQVQAKIREVDDKTREAKNEIRILSIIVAIIATAFV